MYSIKNNILFFIVFIAVVEVQTLEELREETKVLAVAEAAARKTVNDLFSILKLDHAKHKPRFGEFAAIHNFFVTITFQDDDSLKEIAKLARVENVDNSTQSFIALFNEVLNEDNKSYDVGEDEYVTEHIETFIRKLEYLKFKYGFDNNNAKLGINTQILNHLRSDNTTLNNTKVAHEANEGDFLNSNEFWTPGVSRRIFGGKREKIKKFPFMASVQFFKKFQCGGSIIKSDLVITSASCLQLAWNNRFFRENPSFLSVQVGCDLYEGCDENIPVLEVYFHPEYSPKDLKNNLALMRLVRVLKFGKKVKKIKKIDFDREPRPLASNTPGITIIGWGARTISNVVSNVWNNRLMYAVLDFYPLRECQEVYSKEFVTRSNFCAGFFSKGGGACNRDAGGPGIAYGKLIGVVSFGAPNCGAPDAPTVFTKLGYYTDWIEGIMEMDVPTVKKSTTEKMIRDTWDPNSFVISTEKTSRFKISPFTKAGGLRTPIPSEDALRNLDENKLFKEFVKTMFGSEEAKEYLDQPDTETNVTEQKVTSKDITRSKSVKPDADEQEGLENSDEYEVPQEPHKGSVRMVTRIEDFEEQVIKSEEHTTTTTATVTTTPMPITEKVVEEELAEQNIAKLIDDIDIQELLTSIIEKNSEEDKEEAIKPKQAERTKSKINHSGIKHYKETIHRKGIKPFSFKITPITEETIATTEKIKPLTVKNIPLTAEMKPTTDKIKPSELEIPLEKDKTKPQEKKGKNISRNQKSLEKEEEKEVGEDDKIDMVVESTSESVEESETNDDYADDSDDDDGYEDYSSDKSQAEVVGKEMTFRQNTTTEATYDLISRQELLKLFNEAVADVVGTVTSKPYTQGILDRR